MKKKIKVKTSFFIEAISNSLQIKRSPRGGKSKISKQTTLTQLNKNQLLIEAPFKSKLIEIEGVWSEKVDVNSILLEKVVKALMENEYLDLWVNESQLTIKGKAQYNIPILINPKKD